MQLADSNLQLDELSDDLTVCPTIYWAERGAHFVVCKVAPDVSVAIPLFRDRTIGHRP
jgi:hypothetical protein